MNKKLIIMLLAMFVAGTTDLFSQSMNKRTEETPQSVIANVHKAAQLLKEKGSEALAVLTDPKSEFNDRDAYLFIIDVDKSLVVSNPRFPERTGGNIREHLDWSGKHYGVELCEVAMRGGGWIEFVWPKPGTEKGVRKVSYIYPIPGMRYTVCAGIYNDSMTLDELNALTGHGKKDVFDKPSAEPGSSGLCRGEKRCKKLKVAVIFEVTPTAEGKADYFKMGAALKEELQRMPGFISVERFASVNNEGKFLSLSFWESEEAAAGWRNQMNHRASQKLGHDKLFDSYRISVGEIVREYTDCKRGAAPADSNEYLGVD